MSINWRNTLLKKLDEDFKSPHLTLSEALSKPQLFQALSERSPIVTKFIIKHFKEVIDISIGRVPASSDEEQEQCLNIITKIPTIKDSISKNPAIFNYLADSFHPEFNYNPILQLIQGLIDLSCGGVLSYLSDSSKFFKMLLDLLPSPSVQSFLLELLTKPFRAIQTFVIKIEADKILTPYLSESESILLSALSLFSSIVSVLPAKSAQMKCLSSIDFVRMIFEIGVEAPTDEIAYRSFHLLVKICNQCDDSDDCQDLIAIIHFFDAESHKLCSYIRSDESRVYRFTKDKREAGELLSIVISVNEKVSDEIFETAAFLFDAFCKEKTNSFLHQIFVSICKFLADLKSGFPEFIESQKMVERLLQIEESRDKALASYWGHCTVLENLLSKFVKDNDRWDTFVKDVLEPRQEIIKKNYGGKVPIVKVINIDDLDFTDEVAADFNIESVIPNLKNLPVSSSDSDSDDENSAKRLGDDDDESSDSDDLVSCDEDDGNKEKNENEDNLNSKSDKKEKENNEIEEKEKDDDDENIDV